MRRSNCAKQNNARCSSSFPSTFSLFIVIARFLFFSLSRFGCSDMMECNMEWNGIHGAQYLWWIDEYCTIHHTQGREFPWRDGQLKTRSRCFFYHSFLFFSLAPLVLRDAGNATFLWLYRLVAYYSTVLLIFTLVLFFEWFRWKSLLILELTQQLSFTTFYYFQSFLLWICASKDHVRTAIWTKTSLFFSCADKIYHG